MSPHFTSSTVLEKVAETVLAYYRQADALVPTAHEAAVWYARQAPDARHGLVALPFDQWPPLPGFRRFVLESRGHCMPTYMGRCT